MTTIAPEPTTGVGISFLKLKDVCARTSLGKTAIWEAVKNGTFPAPIRNFAGTRNNAWPAYLIDAWAARQLASLEAEEA